MIALVVQPGVEFGSEPSAPTTGQAAASWTWLEPQRPLLFEAHSTDYQSAAALAGLVSDHFAILKVGPALTHAFREAVFELEGERARAARRYAGAGLSRLRETLERAMSDDPSHWRRLRRRREPRAAYLAAFGYSDRVRYYWARPDGARRADRLLANLGPAARRAAPAASLIRERTPRGELRPTPAALARHVAARLAASRGRGSA